MLLGEFIYRGIVYCVKTPLENDHDEDEVIRFRQLEEVREFFAAATDDPCAWPVIMTIAKWHYPGICRPPANCPEPTDREFLDALCLQIFKGQLTLVEVTPDREWVLRDLQLAKCCVDTIKEINGIIINGDVLFAVVLALPLFQAFFYPPGYDKWVSLASTIYSISKEDWKSFGDNALKIPIATRNFAFKAAKEHALLHEFNGDYNLKIFWQGVMNAFE